MICPYMDDKTMATFVNLRPIVYSSSLLATRTLEPANFELETVVMETIYRALKEFLENGETVAVATVTDVKGSAPREVGAQMIIHPLGRQVGTIGGGCGEADVLRAAMDVLQTGEPVNVRVDLTEDISMQALGVCGGIMNVFVERWEPSDQ